MDFRTYESNESRMTQQTLQEHASHFIPAVPPQNLELSNATSMPSLNSSWDDSDL